MPDDHLRRGRRSSLGRNSVVLYRLDLNIAKLKLNIDLFTRAMGMWYAADKVAELNLHGTHAEGLGAGINHLTALRILRICGNLTSVASFRRQHAATPLSLPSPPRSVLVSDGRDGKKPRTKPHVSPTKVTLPPDRSPPPSPVGDYEDAAAAQVRAAAEATDQAASPQRGPGSPGSVQPESVVGGAPDTLADPEQAQRRKERREQQALKRFTRAGSSMSMYVWRASVGGATVACSGCAVRGAGVHLAAKRC